LKNLYIRTSDIVAELSNLSLLTNLQILDVGGSRSFQIESLPDFYKLQIFDISFCKITTAGMNYLSDKTKLQVLKLGGQSQIEKEGYLHIFNLTNLEELFLNNIGKNLKEVLVHLSKFSNLRILNLSNSKFDNLSFLANTLTNLKCLYLCGCDSVTLAALECISHLTKLTTLDIKGCPIYMAQHPLLTRIPNLVM